ncbi:MAG: hypothetical protein ACJKTH_01160 [Patescibacteria group bacterium UBA2163]
MPQYYRYTRGLSLIDVVVGVAIMTVVFLAIFGAFRISIELVFSMKAKTGGVALMTERLERVRALPYGSVGTIGGIPPGVLEQTEQISLNNIRYTIRTVVQYVDAPEDGVGSNDVNSITADYKKVKVEVLWNIKDSPRSVAAVTRVAPPGVETAEDGGTLEVHVRNAAIDPLQGAQVSIVNNNTDPVIDVSIQTNDAGSITLPGAPASGGYEITVTKDDHSTAQTYSASVANPNPSPAHIAVALEETTSISFFIDLLGSLTFSTFEPITTGSFSDTFIDTTKILENASTTIADGTLMLSEATAGVYETSGTAQSVSIAPALLNEWGALDFTHHTPTDTEVAVQVYYHDGTDYVPIDNTALPGNAAGFSNGPVDLTSLNTDIYTVLRLNAVLNTADTATTSVITNWSVTYTQGPTPLPNISFDIHGSKTIGTDGADPVYKYSDTFTTNGQGGWVIEDVEWDSYTAAVTGAYDIVERCPHSIVVSPGENLEPYFYLGANTDHSLRVYVSDGVTPIKDATISVSAGVGSKESSSCGQAYFGDLNNTQYTVTIEHPDFVTQEEVITVFDDALLEVGLSSQP